MTPPVFALYLIAATAMGYAFGWRHRTIAAAKKKLLRRRLRGFA